jgi:hypothetical protein
MMDLIEDPHLVVMNGVVFNSIVDVFRLQSVNDFDAVEPNSQTKSVDWIQLLSNIIVPYENTSRSTTRDYTHIK